VIAGCKRFDQHVRERKNCGIFVKKEEDKDKLLFVIGFPNLEAETGILKTVRHRAGEKLCEPTCYILVRSRRNERDN
jgi:hypothetical protein